MRERIAEMLEQNGVTRISAAQEIGLSKSVLSRKLQTKLADGTPVLMRSDIDWLWAICDLINVDPTTLLGWTPIDVTPAPEEGQDTSPF